MKVRICSVVSKRLVYWHGVNGHLCSVLWGAVVAVLCEVWWWLWRRICRFAVFSCHVCYVKDNFLSFSQFLFMICTHVTFCWFQALQSYSDVVVFVRSKENPHCYPDIIYRPMNILPSQVFSSLGSMRTQLETRYYKEENRVAKPPYKQVTQLSQLFLSSWFVSFRLTLYCEVQTTIIPYKAYFILARFLYASSLTLCIARLALYLVRLILYLTKDILYFTSTTRLTCTFTWLMMYL